mgnify:CR=1 FL=1
MTTALPELAPRHALSRGIYLVTGGGGYLGSHLARTLLAAGRPVRILDVAFGPGCPGEAEAVEVDVRDAAAVRSAMAGVGRVFHVAFVQSLSRRPEAERRAVNLGGTRAVVEAAADAGVDRLVFASTIEIYGTRPPDPCPEDAPVDDPVGWYGLHKSLCEEIVFSVARERGLPATALRMPTICGLGFYNHRPLLSLMDRILDDRTVAVIGDGDVPGDFVHLDDVLQAFRLAGERPGAVGEAFNVSARATATHREVVEAMIAAAHSGSTIRRVPRALARLALPAGRALRLHDLPACQDGYLFHPNRYSIEKARRLLGFAPVHSTVEAATALIRGYQEDRPAARRRAANY